MNMLVVHLSAEKYLCLSICNDIWPFGQKLEDSTLKIEKDNRNLKALTMKILIANTKSKAKVR